MGRQSRDVRRRPARHRVRWACQVVRERDFRLVADQIENLSGAGLLATPADPVLTGERVIVSFQLPEGAWIDTTATVARVIHGRRPGEHRRALGIEFDRLAPESRILLRKALKRCPPAPPCSRPGRRNTKRSVERLVA